MSAPVESIVLVEGFDDRDFWKGLLTRLGCEEAISAPPAMHRESPAFTYLTPSRMLVHVVPYKARTRAFPRGAELADVVKLKLKGRANKPMKRLVLSPDADIRLELGLHTSGGGSCGDAVKWLRGPRRALTRPPQIC